MTFDYWNDNGEIVIQNIYYTGNTISRMQSYTIIQAA